MTETLKVSPGLSVCAVAADTIAPDTIAMRHSKKFRIRMLLLHRAHFDPQDEG